MQKHFTSCSHHQMIYLIYIIWYIYIWNVAPILDSHNRQADRDRWLLHVGLASTYHVFTLILLLSLSLSLSHFIASLAHLGQNGHKLWLAKKENKSSDQNWPFLLFYMSRAVLKVNNSNIEGYIMQNWNQYYGFSG